MILLSIFCFLMVLFNLWIYLKEGNSIAWLFVATSWLISLLACIKAM
jgi:hypothetical protein